MGFVSVVGERASARGDFASVLSPLVLTVGGVDAVLDGVVDEPVGVVDDDVELVDDELVDDELVDDESVPDCADGSANATPEPSTTAAPIPNATASPPIRATFPAAPMRIWLPWVLPTGKTFVEIGSNRHEAYGRARDHPICRSSIRNLHPRR